jgi:hypothetical protein
MINEREVEDYRKRFPLGGGRGDTFANGSTMDWPKCDFCGAVMTQVESEPHVAAFVCPTPGCGGPPLSFDSCRYSDRYCAWVRLLAGEKHAV